jgi:hypothetical protein
MGSASVTDTTVPADSAVSDPEAGCGGILGDAMGTLDALVCVFSVA